MDKIHQIVVQHGLETSIELNTEECQSVQLQEASSPLCLLEPKVIL